MTKRLFVGIAMVSLLLFSCKKEESLEAGKDGGNNNTSTLLRKQVLTFGDDSVVVTFTYDPNKRLTGTNTVGTVLGTSAEGTISIQRNSNGIIQQITEVSDGETIAYTVNYDASKSRYDSKVGVFQDGSKDSVTFFYDASDKLVAIEKFFDDGTTGGYLEYEKTEFGYTGNNVTSESYFEYDPGAGAYTKIQEAVYQYDDKVNPINIGNEGFLLEQVNLTSANNVTKETYTNLDDPSLNDEITYAYSYNADGRPTTSTFTLTSIGLPFPITYTYQ